MTLPRGSAHRGRRQPRQPRHPVGNVRRDRVDREAADHRAASSSPSTSSRRSPSSRRRRKKLVTTTSRHPSHTSPRAATIRGIAGTRSSATDARIRDSGRAVLNVFQVVPQAGKGGSGPSPENNATGSDGEGLPSTERAADPFEALVLVAAEVGLEEVERRVATLEQPEMRRSPLSFDRVHVVECSNSVAIRARCARVDVNYRLKRATSVSRDLPARSGAGRRDR